MQNPFTRKFYRTISFIQRQISIKSFEIVVYIILKIENVIELEEVAKMERMKIS